MIPKHYGNFHVTEEHYLLTHDDVIGAHKDALQLGGGRDGILNESSLLSALARPYNGYYDSIHEKAAALVESFVCNHGFIDANKRTAWILAGTLIRKSGYNYACTDQEIVEVVLKVAKGEMRFEGLSEWFSTRIRKA